MGLAMKIFTFISVFAVILLFLSSISAAKPPIHDRDRNQHISVDFLYPKHYFICYRTLYDKHDRKMIDCTQRAWYRTAPWYQNQYNR